MNLISKQRKADVNFIFWQYDQVNLVATKALFCMNFTALFNIEKQFVNFARLPQSDQRV